MLGSELDNAQQCLLETYEIAANYGSDEFQSTETYLKLMENLCNIRDELDRSERALQTASKERTKAAFEMVFERERKKNTKKFKPQKTAEYKAFEQRLKQITNDFVDAEVPSTSKTRKDGDLLIITSQINPYDPLTMQLLKNPMRNKICGHTYEKATILEQIMKNPIRCPVAGCGNNQFINAKDLFDDNALKLHLQKQANAHQDEEN